ncbi:MAG: hypothetical protein GOVbin2950_29 [Prokaryotic dsDNA virus sp.]|nr:MAG: hypothetical protein GOVbin2950_29 [Prokaryotic dsDNA virus sp.]|tara:strand:- start:302 stop:886 length:585 start_codon:yes stop_codon:yes gene_type:complete
MQLDEVNKILHKFGKYVVQQARTNLSKSGKTKKSRNLYDSIDYKVNQFSDSIDLLFSMEDYGAFQDLGVKGKDPSKVSPNAKITGQQAPNSPYKFGSGSRKGTFKQFAARMSVFAKKRNIRFRQGKTGRFAKGGYDSMGYVIAKNIFNRGIKPSFFFTKPFQAAFKYIPDEVVEAFVFDIEQDERFFPENMNKD